MASDEKDSAKREDCFVFSGEYDYYGRVCSNYGVLCDRCKWLETYRCRDGKVRG
ncbi:MAG: hypothetical protein Q4D58_03855 [Synergistaceae bacterium]|nr:hypothetical protein [Synergistaceae bacterium]